MVSVPVSRSPAFANATLLAGMVAANSNGFVLSTPRKADICAASELHVPACENEKLSAAVFVAMR
ncbi:MAG: hypothetical protein A3D95_11555 [Betaproteobacteria bacterium RIFCSPHIGHO2_12_FULL_69_13]|nr:MAG: hypothetical protein A3D95_11555 [Betaproteobacteria bacterium RIFCSPHIGHO2_12_FULL_69_13]